MNRIELIYDRTCPNVAAARVQVRDALSLAGLPPHWQEWDREGRDTPASLRSFGSPTILVDGRDVSGGHAADDSLPSANACRIYADAEGRVTGVPALQWIVTALQRPPG